MNIVRELRAKLDRALAEKEATKRNLRRELDRLQERLFALEAKAEPLVIRTTDLVCRKHVSATGLPEPLRGCSGCFKDQIAFLVQANETLQEQLVVSERERQRLFVEGEELREDLEEARRELKESERWEVGFRNIVSYVVGPTVTFDIPDVVRRVRDLVRAPR